MSSVNNPADKLNVFKCQSFFLYHPTLAPTQRPGAMTFLLRFPKNCRSFFASKNKHSIRFRWARDEKTVKCGKMKFENHEMLICSNVRKTRRERRRQNFGFHFLSLKILFSSGVIQTLFCPFFWNESIEKRQIVESENNMRFFRCVIIHNTMDGQSQMIYNCT